MAKLIDYDLFARNIKRLCKEKGMTQKELEVKCGFANSAISTYTTGRYSPTVRRLQEMACALDVDVRELLRPEREDMSEYNIVRMFKRMSPSMQKAIFEIMKTQQGDKC